MAVGRHAQLDRPANDGGECVEVQQEREDACCDYPKAQTSAGCLRGTGGGANDRTSEECDHGHNRCVVDDKCLALFEGLKKVGRDEVDDVYEKNAQRGRQQKPHQYLEDAGKAGDIELTGLGLPSEMKQYIKNGTCRKMSLWNPIDLGYSATYIAYRLITGEFTGSEGESMNVGRMGDIIIGGGNVAVMSEPYVFDKDNIDKFAAIY